MTNTSSFAISHSDPRVGEIHGIRERTGTWKLNDGRGPRARWAFTMTNVAGHGWLVEPTRPGMTPRIFQAGPHNAVSLVDIRLTEPVALLLDAVLKAVNEAERRHALLEEWERVSDALAAFGFLLTE